MKSAMLFLLAFLPGIVGLPGTCDAVLTFEVSGTYDTNEQTVFGENGSAIPYLYRFTVDANVMTLMHHIPTATDVDGRLTTEDWYGYDGAGITLLQATFGTVDWTAGGTIVDLSPGPGYTAKLWMDAPLSTTNQTGIWLQLYRSDVEATLEIGRQGVSDFYTFLLNDSSITDSNYHEARSIDMTVTVVPEPGTSGLLLLGAVGLGGYALRRSLRVTPLTRSEGRTRHEGQQRTCRDCSSSFTHHANS